MDSKTQDNATNRPILDTSSTRYNSPQAQTNLEFGFAPRFIQYDRSNPLEEMLMSLVRRCDIFSEDPPAT